MFGKFGVGLVLTSTLGVTAVWADTVFISGLEPWKRPDNAPTITEVVRDVAWYDRALHGVDQPYPASLRFLEDQGNWFNPFTAPGMTGPYDIRGWHHD